MDNNLETYARQGAIIRREQLLKELAQVNTFLGRLKPTRVAGNSVDTPVRRRPKMSAAAKKAVSLRMKKYWAEKRKGKKA